MWWTPEGERVLRGAEWALVRAGVEALRDEIEAGLADPGLGLAVTGSGRSTDFPRPGSWRCWRKWPGRCTTSRYRVGS